MLNKSQRSNLRSQNFLEKIVHLKRLEISKKAAYPEVLETQNLRKSESAFLNAIRNENGKLKLIAEIKFASPTDPHLGSSEELLNRAKQYREAGADAISIITEEHFFKGDIALVSEVRKNVPLPILQKDFIIDPIQIHEARKAGADALLLIARLVAGGTLKELVKRCFAEGIEPVVEINNKNDLEKAIATETKIIAVNARDLETFAIDVAGACILIEKIPNTYIKLGFSGITSQKEAVLYKESGATGILVGTSLMKTKNIKRFIKEVIV